MVWQGELLRKGLTYISLSSPHSHTRENDSLLFLKVELSKIPQTPEILCLIVEIEVKWFMMIRTGVSLWRVEDPDQGGRYLLRRARS